MTLQDFHYADDTKKSKHGAGQHQAPFPSPAGCSQVSNNKKIHLELSKEVSIRINHNALPLSLTL